MIKKLCLISIMLSTSLVFAEGSSVKINMEPVIASIENMGNSKVSAYVRGSTVTVYGIVTSEEMKQNVANSIKMQNGVEDVENLIAVNPEYGMNLPTDPEVKTSVEKALKELGVNFKTLTVNEGVVAIEADLSTFREVDLMLATILGINGVKGIKPSTLVNGKPYLSEVTKNF